MKNVLAEITRLRLERGWNEYELAKHCGLSQSTISTWYRKNQTPTIQTLDKVCKGLITQSTISTWYRENQLPTIKSLDKICSGCGITLSQFFAENGDAISLTPKQREMLDNWSSLTEIQQELFLKLFKSIP